jgi:transcription initiation factor TFIID subunit 5
MPPFPKFHLDEEYDNEEEAKRDRQRVEFNRALLVNGFRRLEALERKREFETLPPTAKKRIKAGERLPSTADPLQPSILLTTLSSTSSEPVLKAKSASSGTTRSTPTDITSIWEEPGIGLCCARLCPPDGRRVAVGCDDAAIRIWSAENSKPEPIQILLGHKNGFPVFDVDWNRDGRSLLSAGGDGSVRLWDTMATGPFGEVAIVKSKRSGGGQNPTLASEGPDMTVPGFRPNTASYSSGSALAVYRGHAPSAPVWSVAFAPSGYYFASAGGDATARLWTTDRPVPVRLFTGHSASNVNCVEWHPNCNYLLTGSDDKTARLWDIQSGRTVRLLGGCAAGVNAVRVSPGGRYAAVVDYSGVVGLWDLGMGKKMTQFRAIGRAGVHSLRFSSCGTALATGCDDCCVRIWDVRLDACANKPVIFQPTKSFPTKQTLLMDLYFTKRNLLLAVGKAITPVPLLTPACKF